MALAEHLEKIRYFHRLVNYRSLREGAVAMGISQAGLSKSLAALEDALGTQLFLRSRAGLILTKEGQELLTTTRKILGEAAALETKLRKLKVVAAPSVLKIGMYDSIAVYFFSELKAYIGTLYPQVQLQLTVDTSSALSLLVQQGELDLAIGVNLDRTPKSSVEYFNLFDDHYSFYLSTRHDLDVGALPLLIHARADDQAGKNVESYLASSIKSRGVHKVFNFETLKTLTLQGLGIGVMPTQVAKPLLKQGLLITTEVPKTKHLFGP
ncbi:MAG: LysR family transcriptional regulator, partial [Proteobacteria bacterium]